MCLSPLRVCMVFSTCHSWTREMDFAEQCQKEIDTPTALFINGTKHTGLKIMARGWTPLLTSWMLTTHTLVDAGVSSLCLQPSVPPRQCCSFSNKHILVGKLPWEPLGSTSQSLSWAAKHVDPAGPIRSWATFLFRIGSRRQVHSASSSQGRKGISSCPKEN